MQAGRERVRERESDRGWREGDRAIGREGYRRAREKE